MDKGGDLRHGRSSRLATPMRQTGGDSDVFLDKSSKKDKLRRLSCVGMLGEMDQLSHPISTNSTSKRVKLPKKFSDHCGTINHASAPRKLRSAMKKRQHESQKIYAPVLPDSRNEIGGFELQSKDCTKKHIVAADEHDNSKISPRESVITKDEEEVAEALFALAQTFTNTDVNGTSEAEPTSMPGLLVLQESMHVEPPNEAENTNNVSNGKKTQKRCSVHVYICRFIKDLQGLGTDEGSKQGARVNVISDTNPQKITNEYANKMLYKVENTCKGLFQEQQQAFDIVSLVAGNGGGVEGSNVFDRPKTTREATSTQLQHLTGVHLTNTQNHHSSSFDGHLSTAGVEKVLPYFDTMDYDHSQWSTHTLSKQQPWGNQFTSTGYYQNWQKQRHDTMAPFSGSAVEIFDSKHTQGSLLEVLGSKHTLNTEQQQQQQQQQCISMSLLVSDKGKMQFSDHPGYDETGGLFFVDNGPMLKLTL